MPATAQPTGLVFNSYDQVQEKRTSLVLNGGQPLCLEGNASLSFAFRFFPDRQVYYGYLVRLINNQQQNIDLIYNHQEQQFTVVTGNTFTPLHFRLDSTALFHNWNTCTLTFKGNTLLLSINGKPCGSARINISDPCYRIVFGACRLPHFKTSDVPPMTIRNISIQQAQRLRYYWPLNELSGNQALDSLQGVTATVTNPVWAKPLHQHWQLLQTLRVTGNGSYAFDPAEEAIHIIGQDTVYRFLVRDRSLARLPVAQPVYLSPGYQAAFDPGSRTLYSVHVDQKELAGWLPDKRQWSRPFDSAGLTSYWQTSKFIRQADSSLYIIGGYGQLTYKKTIQRFSLATGLWGDVKVAGEALRPRYLAAVGTSSAGDTAYILGGYGSDNGEQMLNPKYYYDLLRYDVKHSVIEKVYDFGEPEDAFVFASSMVVNTAENSFYALAFPNDRYQSRLQLVKGSLSQADFTNLADTIPYAFLDNRSGADLYYCARTQQLLAVTQIMDKDQHTDIRIYSLAFPAEQVSAMATSSEKYALRGWWAGVIVLSMCMGVFVLYRRRRRKVVPPGANVASAEATAPEGTDISLKNEITPATHTTEEDATAVTTEPVAIAGDQTSEETAASQTDKALFRLFGEFQVLDKNGNVLTHLFSPLLKEMFLLITIHTLWSGKGVSTGKLYEILWADKSDRDARNNRSVNMVKLKGIFEKVGNISVVKEEHQWRVNYDPESVEVDLGVFMTLINQATLQPAELQTLIGIIREGGFLFRTDYFWLEDIKSNLTSRALDVLQVQLEQLITTVTPELIIETANTILILDPLHEAALKAKCTAMIRQGRPSLAKAAYEKFFKDYSHMYGEKFPVSFQDIIS